MTTTKTTEDVLKDYFGGLIGEKGVYITDKDSITEAMQAYADQQVNKVLDEALLICYNHDGIDNWLELRQKLEKLKIKQP